MNRNTLPEQSPGNVPGAYYVSLECIDCGLCYDMAPACFRRNEESGLSMVHCQPSNEAELALAEEALQACPVEAIHNDGERFAQGASSGRSLEFIERDLA